MIFSRRFCFTWTPNGSILVAVISTRKSPVRRLTWYARCLMVGKHLMVEISVITQMSASLSVRRPWPFVLSALRNSIPLGWSRTFIVVSLLSLVSTLWSVWDSTAFLLFSRFFVFFMSLVSVEWVRASRTLGSWVSASQLCCFRGPFRVPWTDHHATIK